MTPISKIKKIVVEDVRNFKNKWKCCFNDPPPVGSKVFALMICKDIFPNTRNDPNVAPQVIHAYVGDPMPYPCSNYYLIGEGGEKTPPDPESMIERHDYEMILWIDEKDYFEFSENLNEYNPNPWIFVKEHEGTYEEAFEEAGKLAKDDPEYSYHIWDQRQ